METETVDRYTITSEGIETPIEIAKENHSITYKLILPEIDIATEALLDEVKFKIVADIDVTPTEVFDPASLEELKNALKTISHSV